MLKYKFCNFYPNCNKNNSCNFAHSFDELFIDECYISSHVHIIEKDLYNKSIIECKYKHSNENNYDVLLRNSSYFNKINKNIFFFKMLKKYNNKKIEFLEIKENETVVIKCLKNMVISNLMKHIDENYIKFKITVI